ncbi:alpha-glucosidase C-terminal domain-containing protein [Paracerasibacillus soli]
MELQNLDSILNYYKKMIRLREENDVLIYGSYELTMMDHEDIFAYKRVYGNETYLVLANLFAKEVTVEFPNELAGEQAELKLSNYEVENGYKTLDNLDSAHMKHAFIEFESWGRFLCFIFDSQG